MTAGRIGEDSIAGIVDAVPDGEVAVVVPIHLKHCVQCGQDFHRIAEVGRRQGTLAQHVQDTDRQHRRTDAVSSDIDQIEGELTIVEASVTQRVAAKPRRRLQDPLSANRPVLQWWWQKRLDVAGRSLQVAIVLLRALEIARRTKLTSEQMLTHAEHASYW